MRIGSVYRDNGAIPGAASCQVLASTVSVGLGNYYYRTFSGPRYVDNFCDAEIQDPDWIDLTPLQENYEDERFRATPDTAFAHQFECIAEQACLNHDFVGADGWAFNFVKYLFDEMNDENGLPGSVEVDCPAELSGKECFDLKGRTHAWELIKGFYGFCFQQGTLVDYDRWDDDHIAFLDNGVKYCFAEVVNSNELTIEDGATFSIGVPLAATVLREGVQLDCRVWNFLRSSFAETGYQPKGQKIDILAHLTPSNANASFGNSNAQAFTTRNVVIPENLRKPLPVREDFYEPLWEESGDLTVTTSNDGFFVKPGEQITFTVTRELTDGTTEILDEAAGLEFKFLTNEQHVDITASGVLTVNSVATPFSTFTEADVVLVAASANGQFGVGQVMIIDDDTDGDILLDSYEDSVGLNKLVATNVFEEDTGGPIVNAALDYTEVTVPNIESITGAAPVEISDDDGQSTFGDVGISGSTTSGGSSGGGAFSLWLSLVLIARWIFFRRRARLMR